MLVRSLVSVTSTPGMTPPESLIDPRRPPWKPWPNARLAEVIARNAPRTRAARILIVPPRLWCRRTDVRELGYGDDDATTRRNQGTEKTTGTGKTDDDRVTTEGFEGGF